MKSIRIGNDIRIEWPIVLSGDVSKLQDLDLTVEVRPSAKIIDTHNYADEMPDKDNEKRPVFIKTETTVMMNGGITCRPDIGDGKEHCRPRPCPPHPHRPVPPAPVRLPYHIEDNTLIAMWTADRQFATGDYDIILYAHKNEGGQAVCDQYRFVRLVSHTAEADAPDDSGIEAVIAMQPVTLELSGLSAYEVAVINGFQGTEEEWLQSLKQPAIDAAEQAKEDIEQFKTETKAEVKQDITNLNANTGVDEYPVFSESEAYSAGDIVNYQGKLYRFTTDHAAGAWTGSDVEKTSLNKIILNSTLLNLSKNGKTYTSLCEAISDVPLMYKVGGLLLLFIKEDVNELIPTDRIINYQLYRLNSMYWDTNLSYWERICSSDGTYIENLGGKNVFTLTEKARERVDAFTYNDKEAEAYLTGTSFLMQFLMGVANMHTYTFECDVKIEQSEEYSDGWLFIGNRYESNVGSNTNENSTKLVVDSTEYAHFSGEFINKTGVVQLSGVGYEPRAFYIKNLKIWDKDSLSYWLHELQVNDEELQESLKKAQEDFSDFKDGTNRKIEELQKKGTFINLSSSNNTYSSLQEAISDVPTEYQVGGLVILFAHKYEKTIYIDDIIRYELYQLTTYSWSDKVYNWRMVTGSNGISIEQADFVDLDIQNNLFEQKGIDKFENLGSEWYIKNTGVGIGLVSIYVGAADNHRYAFEVEAKNDTTVYPDCWLHIGNGYEIESATNENTTKCVLNTDKYCKFTGEFVNRRGFLQIVISFVGGNIRACYFKNLRLIDKDSLSYRMYQLENITNNIDIPTTDRVINGIDAQNLHFKLKSIFGKSWQRLPLYRVNFFESENNNFIIDWNDVFTNVTNGSIVKGTNMSHLNIKFTGDGDTKQYLLYKLNFRHTSSNEYIRFHIDQFNTGEELAVGRIIDADNYWIISILMQDNVLHIAWQSKSGETLYTSEIDDYPNFSNKLDVKSIVEAGDFDVEIGFFGTQFNVNIVKGEYTYPILKGQANTYCEDTYLKWCQTNEKYYYIGTSNFINVDGKMPNVYDIECGASSMWDYADCKVIRNSDGSLYTENGYFYFTASAHGCDLLVTGGCIDIFRTDINSLKMDFVGTLNAKCNGYTDIFQSCSIIYDKNSKYWYITGTNFGLSARKIVSEDNTFAVSYIAKTSKNPIGGIKVVDAQILNLPDRDNAFDFDFLFNSDTQKWVGILQGGDCYTTDDPMGQWTKTSSAFNYNDGSKDIYTEGACLAIVNNKLLYTAGTSIKGSPIIRDYTTNTHIGITNKDVPITNDQGQSPGWGCLFSICRKGITKYYLIVFSMRRLMGYNYGYGDLYLYESDEEVEGREYI